MTRNELVKEIKEAKQDIKDIIFANKADWLWPGNSLIGFDQSKLKKKTIQFEDFAGHQLMIGYIYGIYYDRANDEILAEVSKKWRGDYVDEGYVTDPLNLFELRDYLRWLAR